MERIERLIKMVLSLDDGKKKQVELFLRKVLFGDQKGR